jgi:uncharacterized protein (DUF302 family)
LCNKSTYALSEKFILLQVTVNQLTQNKMSYYYTKTVQGTFDQIIEKVNEELKKEGFGVLTQIDVKATLKQKLDINFPPYTILGACNPEFAHEALLAENKIGTMLPCNVIVQEHENGEIEVSAVDPVASMMAVKNDQLCSVANEVGTILQRVINNL